MNWQLTKLDLRKTLPYYLACCAAIIGCILTTQEVLDSSNLTILTIALAQGWLLAWRIFHDPVDTESFVFSRPFTRSQVFINRWALGMILQGLTVLAVYTVLAAGTRTLLYKRHLPYFPMVERFELSILWPIALASIITFHIIMFLIARGRISNPNGSTRTGRLVVKIVLLVIFMIFVGGTGIRVASGGHGSSAPTQSVAFLLIYATAVILLSVPGSLNCYRHMEIKS